MMSKKLAALQNA